MFRELLTCGAGALVRLYTRNYSTRKQIHTQATGRNRRPHLILILLPLPRCTYPIDLFAYPLPGLSIRLCGQAQPRFILVKIPLHMCSFLMSFRHSEDLRRNGHLPPDNSPSDNSLRITTPRTTTPRIRTIPPLHIYTYIYA